MTLKFPKPSFLDQMLRLIGKKRCIIIPSDSFNKHREYVYLFAKKESFLLLFLDQQEESCLKEELMYFMQGVITIMIKKGDVQYGREL